MTKWAAASTKGRYRLMKPISWNVDDDETTFSADEARFIVVRSALQMSIAFHEPSIIAQVEH
jgi:hypothetical protein